MTIHDDDVRTADLIDNSESILLSAHSLTSAEELVWRWIYTGSSDGENSALLVRGARRALACLFSDDCSITAALKGPVSGMTRVYAVFLSITFLFEGQVCILYQRT